ncbi:DUF4402 domain-containing protein [Gillisia sp. CAL575]|uniref:DUF4402 domain-containing protein n=1 Tax=Gillisia sp. CAL575 TaxID=985255 RepID=UPI0003A00324|nr:DUF4402 domain-containing protein [Gillisia sp. CAL575]
MKKITFILFALIAGTTFAQDAASAVVNAAIVSPITIVKVGDLNFGTINGTATGGNVTVTNGGNRSFANDDMVITSATPITAAIFNITAASSYSYSISIPPSTLAGGSGGDPMNVTFTHSREGSTKRIGDGLEQELRVGGTLVVNNAQKVGAYTGTVEVTVAYE